MPPELREALENAITQSESTPVDAPKETAAPISEASPVDSGGSTNLAEASSVESSKDNAGTNDAPASVEAKPAPSEPEKTAPVVGETAAERAAHRVDRPPQSWKKESKGEWANLPLHVRQEVHRRESQVNQVLYESARHKEISTAIQNVVAPYAERVQQFGGPIPTIERLLKVESMLATGSPQEVAQNIAQLIKDYNVDLPLLDNILSGQFNQQPSQQPNNVPDLGQLVQQHVQQALAPIFQERQQAQQQSYQAVVQTIEEMALDPRFPYFEEVRNDMADIIDVRAKRGIAIGLPEAYAIAVQLNPEVASQMQKQSTILSAEQKHSLAQRAVNAASSITGSPAGGGGQAVVGDGSLRGAIEAAFGGQRL